jgi:hypothetical protein
MRWRVIANTPGYAYSASIGWRQDGSLRQAARASSKMRSRSSGSCASSDDAAGFGGRDPGAGRAGLAEACRQLEREVELRDERRLDVRDLARDT